MIRADFRAVDDPHLLLEILHERRFEKRIMSAAEQKRIRRIPLDIVKINIENGMHERTIGQPLFSHRNKKRTCNAFHDDPGIDRMDASSVCIAVYRCPRSDHGQFFGSGTDHRLNTGFQHAEDMNSGETAPQRIHRNRRNGIARDHDHLDSFGKQEFRILKREFPDGIHRFIPVRDSCGISEIYDILIGQKT